MSDNIYIEKKCKDIFNKFFDKDKLNIDEVKFTLDIFYKLVIQIYEMLDININEINSDLTLVISDNDYCEILLLLFPYIDQNKYEKLKEIRRMKDIFEKPIITKYIYNNNKIKNYSYKEIINEKYEHIINCIKLYKHSFYVNWYTIFPLLFKEEYERKINLKQYEEEDVIILESIKKYYYGKNNILIKFKPFEDKYYDKKNNIFIIKYYNSYFAKYLIYNLFQYDNITEHIQHNKNNVDTDLITLVVLYKFVSGILSKIILKEEDKPNLKDKTILKKYDNCYNYLTNMTYEDLKLRNKEIFKNNIKYKKSINEEIAKQYKRDVEYYDFQFGDLKENRNVYSIRWIAQLKLFITYSSTNILFITGETGVGKSTQIPKLLSYLTIAIDHIPNSRTISTSPRKNAVQNIDYISKLMGILLPYDKADMNLQYYTSDDKDKSIYHYKSPIFKMTTDGTLYNEIILNGNTFIFNDILIKKQIINFYKHHEILKNYNINFNNLTSYEILKYIDRILNTKYIDLFRLYHNIIIDEVHEHNNNIDCILSLANELIKKGFINKLCLISATLEMDEIKFRTFFNFKNNNFIDNRCHFSELFTTTKYNIKEIYVDKFKNIDIKNEMNTEKIEGERNEEIINIIKNLKGNYTNILIFKPGKSEIYRLLFFIENKLMLTDETIIPIPYYSDINDKFKEEIIKDVNHTIKLDFSLIKKFNYNLDDHNNSLNAKTYKHYIFISTNIAEASITINPLDIVIDDGLKKTTYFNYFQLSNDELKPELITENNRKQRKGRVGRISDGEAYFLYPKNILNNNNIKYSISDMDIRPFVFNLLNNNIDNNKNNNSMVISLDKLIDYNNTFYLSNPFINYPFLKNNKQNFFNLIMQSYYDFHIIKKINNEFVKTDFGNIVHIIYNQLYNFTIDNIVCLLNAYSLNIVNLMINFLCIMKDSITINLYSINQNFKYDVINDSDYLNVIKHMDIVEKIIFNKSLNEYLIEELNNITIDNDNNNNKYNIIQYKINNIMNKNKLTNLINNVAHQGNINFNIFDFYSNLNIKDDFIKFCIKYFDNKINILLCLLLSFHTIDNINFINNPILNYKKLNFDLSLIKSFTENIVFSFSDYNKLSYLLIKYMYQHIHINYYHYILRNNINEEQNILNRNIYVNILSLKKNIERNIKNLNMASNVNKNFKNFNLNDFTTTSYSFTNNSLFMFSNSINKIENPFAYQYSYKHNINSNLINFLPKYYRMYYKQYIGKSLIINNISEYQIEDKEKVIELIGKYL